MDHYLLSPGHGVNEHEGGTLPTYDPSWHCMTSMAHLTFSGLGDFLNHNGEGDGEVLFVTEGVGVISWLFR